MRGAASLICGLAALFALAANAQQRPNIVPQPLFPEDAQACVTVANLTEYNWPIGIRREGRVNSTVIAKPREVNRYCAPDRLGADEFIRVQLKSSWFPLGECELKNRGTMEIYREKSTETDSGEVTRVKCYGGR
jgi:hypothetical protein